MVWTLHVEREIRVCTRMGTDRLGIGTGDTPPAA
jgi:hypothetical protein